MSDGKRAVIIGGSMAGLLAAAAVAPFFAQVLILERDTRREAIAPRKGVPQGAHVHGFLAAGRIALEQLLPGIVDDVVAQGGAVGDMLKDALFYVGKHTRFVSGDSGIAGLVASRPLLEHVVAGRVAAISRVELRHGVSVGGLVFSGDGRRVVGVSYSTGGAAPQTLDADLVIDASGRGSRARQCLQQAGFPLPMQDTLAVNITYSSCWFRRREPHGAGVRAVFVAPDAANPVPSGMMEQEGERWIVSCGSYGDSAAPATLEAFRDYIRRHSAPEIAAVISQAEAIGAPQRFKYPASVRNRYDKLSRFPAGYLVTGDALCSFNPVYGQGMTIAAQQALALRDCLAAGGERIWPAFFRRAARVVADPWEFAIASDLALPCVEAKRPVGFALMQRYVDRVMHAASRDMAVARAVLRVVHMLDRPTALLAPQVVYRALRAGRA